MSDDRRTYYREDALIPDIYAPWRDQAACSDVVHDEPHMDEAWITQHSLYSERARMICEEECPVRMACLHDALSDRHAEGMRGGFFFDAGQLEPRESQMLYREFRLRVRPRRPRRHRAEQIA